MSDIPRNPFAGKTLAITYMGNNAALYNRAVSRFYENYEDLADKIVNLLKEDSYDDARILVHSIKGLSRTLGMTYLGDASEVLQYAIESKSNITSALEEFTVCLEEVFAARPLKYSNT